MPEDKERLLHFALRYLPKDKLQPKPGITLEEVLKKEYPLSRVFIEKMNKYAEEREKKS